MQNTTYKIANTLLTRLAACEHVTIEEYTQDTLNSVEYGITVDLGTGWAGDYAAADWGGWGEVSITDDRLYFTTSVIDWTDSYGDYNYSFNEGYVRLHYKDFETAGLAYTSKLEDAIVAAILERTDGCIVAGGSEQGMQGMDSADECYLSMDVAAHDDLDESADLLTAEQRAEREEEHKRIRAKYA